MTITLATLAQASAQAVFDQVARHLLTQNMQALNDAGDCVYRTAEGQACAAGCLIAAHELDPAWNVDTSWASLVQKEHVPAAHCDLIDRLQCVHDDHRPEHWPEQLELVADIYGLDASGLSEM